MTPVYGYKGGHQHLLDFIYTGPENFLNGRIFNCATLSHRTVLFTRACTDLCRCQHFFSWSHVKERQIRAFFFKDQKILHSPINGVLGLEEKTKSRSTKSDSETFLYIFCILVKRHIFLNSPNTLTVYLVNCHVLVVESFISLLAFQSP